MQPHILTAESLEKIKREFRYLVDIERPAVIKEIQAAREQGDLSENADYTSAKERQSQVEFRIKELQEIIDNHQIISESGDHPTNRKQITIGSIVEALNLVTQKTHKYEIVGSFETDPKNGKISNESPLAKALLDKRSGDTVEVKGIAKPSKWLIKSVN